MKYVHLIVDWLVVFACFGGALAFIGIALLIIAGKAPWHD